MTVGEAQDSRRLRDKISGRVLRDEYVTTISFFLAAVAIFSSIMSPLASRLITAEIIGFQILVWIPKLFVGPPQPLQLGGNGINMALASAAWVVSDSISGSSQKKS